MIYLDTHVVVWLYAGRLDLLPQPVRRLLEAHELLVSPIVALELQYLFETSRTKEPAEPVLGALRREVGLHFCELAFDEVVAGALQEDWTRDPFDRLIVAHARLRGTRLLTRDRTIAAHFEGATWDDLDLGDRSALST